VGRPLDVAELDPARRYLWVVDTAGDFRVAPEEQAGFHPRRSTVKHADLIADGETATRGEARIGGELRAELRDGVPTGRWIMDDESSYSGVRSDLLLLGPEHLTAVRDLLAYMGTDVSPIVLQPHGSDPPPLSGIQYP
jgi:hypothetical protein